METGSGLPDRLPLRLLDRRWEGSGPFMPGGEPTVSTGGGGGGGRVSLPALMLRPRVGVLVADDTVGVLLLELLVLGGAGGGCEGRCELARVPLLRLGV